FYQSPGNKMLFVNGLRKIGNRVIMVGDGLNDAGALRESDVGITVAENLQVFTPASDAILEADSIIKLPAFVAMSRKAGRIIYGSFIFSVIYNAFGLSFAVTGTLQPWVAAILMPVSSITVVIYSQLMVRRAANKMSLTI